jgi:hypothetical protein
VSEPDLAAVRPRLREDCSIFPAEESVFFENDSQSFALRGAGLYPLLQALRPLLDGRRTVQEILTLLPAQIRETVGALLAMLLDRTILVDQPAEGEVELPAPMRARFAPQIELLTHLVERPLAAFQAFRGSRVLLTGSGLQLAACAAALLRYGLARVELLPFGPETAERPLGEVVAEAVAELAAAGVESAAETVGSRVEELRGRVGGAALVLYCSDRSTFRDLVWLNRECARVRRPLLPGIVFQDRSLMGPLLEPPVVGCWVCGVCRQAGDLVELRQLPEFVHKTSYPGGGTARAREPQAVPAVAVNLGRQMAFEAFKLLAAGARAQSRQGMLVETLDGGDSMAAEMVPFPLCGCTRYCDAYCSG